MLNFILKSMKSNELKVTDLMVGDWVKLHYDINYKTGESLYTNVRITSINEDGTINVSMHDGDGWDADLINPIPITKELLEKNGFEVRNRNEGGRDFITSRGVIDNGKSIVKMHNHAGYIHTSEKWDVGINIILDPNRLDPIGNIINSTIAYCELTYLHELQHLLKLCNIDFEFVV